MTNVLFIAPQPFFQERGTPIAVRLALENLAITNPSILFTLVTYNEGENISIPNVVIKRIPNLSFLQNVRAGISLKKIICDFLIIIEIFKLFWTKGIKHFQLVHAVEEGIFIAILIRFLFRIPYICDLDSSITMQLTQKWKFLKPVNPLLNSLERLSISQSKVVIAVCNELVRYAEQSGAKQVQLLRDVPLLDKRKNPGDISLRQEIDIPPEKKIITYIGNLETYQGVDLLLEGSCNIDNTVLVVIGGPKSAAEAYREKYHSKTNIYFLGPRPLENISAYLSSSDILVSPRLPGIGNNTPMKIYSYLAAGKPILATDIPCHQEVLNNHNSLLVPAETDSIRYGLERLISDEDLCKSISQQAREDSEKLYSLESFRVKLSDIYSLALKE